VRLVPVVLASVAATKSKGRRCWVLVLVLVRPPGILNHFLRLILGSNMSRSNCCSGPRMLPQPRLLPEAFRPSPRQFQPLRVVLVDVLLLLVLRLLLRLVLP